MLTIIIFDCRNLIVSQEPDLVNINNIFFTPRTLREIFEWEDLLCHKYLIVEYVLSKINDSMIDTLTIISLLLLCLLDMNITSTGLEYNNKFVIASLAISNI